MTLPSIVLLVLTAILPVAASSQNLSTMRITVRVQRVSIKAALREIQRHSKVKFFYGADVDRYDPVRVSLSGNEQNVRQAIERVLAGTDLRYTQKGYHVMIDARPIKTAPTPVPKPKLQQPGRVSGKVVDERGDALAGATVKVVEINRSLQSGLDGGYNLPLTPGTYTLEISYLGYQAKRITGVAVRAGEQIPLDVALQPSSATLGEASVTASYRRASIEGLYAQQKNAAAITDGISADQIARTPDKNVAEVLKRVSGVSIMDNKYVVVRGLSERYNESFLNGQAMPSTEINRKQFSFDLIPSSLVDQIVVSKTITPDRSAEFGGGSVEVRTKDIPAANFFHVSIGGGYNDQTTGKDFRSLQLEGKEYLGQVADHRKLFGRLDWKSSGDIVANLEQQDDQSYSVQDLSSFPNNWGMYRFQAAPSSNLQASLGRVVPLRNEGHKLGIIASASYRNTMQTQDITMGTNDFGSGASVAAPLFEGKRYGLTANLAGLVGAGYSTGKHKVSAQSLYLRTLDQQLVFGAGPHNSPSGTLLAYADLTTQTKLWQNQLKGEHTLGNRGIKLNWMGSYTRLDRQKPDNHFMKTGYVQAPEEQPEHINITNPTVSSINHGALRWWNRALESNFNYQADLTVPFRFDAGKVVFSNVLKAGYAGWTKDRLFYVLNSGTQSDKSLAPGLETVFAPDNLTGITFSQFNDDFDRTASLHAVYGMLDNKIGSRWRLVWGQRAEYYDLNAANQNLEKLILDINTGRNLDEELDFSLLYNRERNWHFFPSANLTYSLTPTMNFRLAYAESIIRPDLRELSFFQEYDFELGGEYIGNSVRSTTARHVDFRYEWYPAPGEVVSVSAFYKRFAYPMEIYEVGGVNRYELFNNKRATNSGFEVEVRKSFAFTEMPVLRNLTVYGNFSMLTATVTPMKLTYELSDPNNLLKVIPTETLGEKERRPQTGASNYLYNAALYYDARRFSVSLSYNYVTNRMYRPTELFESSLFERPLEALDGQVAFRLFRQRGEVKLNVGNLLNSSSVIYNNSYDPDENGIGSSIPKDGRKPSTGELLYQDGVDILRYRARPGRTYSLSLNYNF